MRLTITGKNIELTEGLKAAVEERLSKLDRYFGDDAECKVTLSVEKERKKAEATVYMKGYTVRSEQVSNDMYISIDLVEETIERQFRKYKEKLVTKNQSTAADLRNIPYDDEEDEKAPEIKVVRTKRFNLKPMYTEDACIEMELLGHDFYVFRNAETDEVNVVYKRRGNTYGLIEPEE